MQVQESEDFITVQIPADVGFRTIHSDRVLLELLEKGKSVRVDLSEAKGLDHLWLRAFATLTFEAQKKGIKFTLCNVSKEIIDAYEYLGTLRHVVIE